MLDLEKILFEENLTTLFKEEEVFDTLNHLPESYKYRDSQISEILRGIRPGLKNEKLESKLIIGEPSTGKTTAIKKVFQTIDENTHRIKTVYINCNIYATIYEIYKKIVLSLDKDLFKPKMDKNILFDIIIDYLAKNNVSLLICLDDVYRLETTYTANQVLFELLRSSESYFVRIGLLIVLSESDFKYKFSRRVGNVLILNEIIFPEYTRDEIYHILRNRCEIGLLPGVISDDVIWSVADYSYRNFDLRGGIELLHSAVVLAEVEGAYEVNDWHIEKTLPL